MRSPPLFLRALCFGVVSLLCISALSQTKPNLETFKQVISQSLQKLLISGYTERDVRFVSVQAGNPKNGAYPFRATIVVRDYGAGFPKNRYYGQTCVGKLINQEYWMTPDDFGGWKVQGVMTPSLSTQTCKNNPSEGVSSMPADTLEGTPASAAKQAPRQASAPAPQTNAAARSGLTTGEWACYGSGGRALIGLGFKVAANGAYTDLDGGSRGTYALNAGTVTFTGGHLGGQVARSVGGGKFNIGTTTCEPNR